MICKNKAGFTLRDKQMFTQLLYANGLRGFDSTGVFSVNKEGNLKMIKAAQRVDDFIQTKTYENFEEDIFRSSHIVIGHNRASTRGATNDQNAHPFIEKDTCLIHNGTLYAHKHLGDAEVDSHAICQSIAKDGHLTTLPKISGAFALIWYKADQKKLYICRNKERPLYIIELADVDVIVSEPDMAFWILNRNFTFKTNPEAKYFDTELIYHYDVDNLKEGFKTEPMPKKVMPAITTPTNGPATTSQGGTLTDIFKGVIGDKLTFENLGNSIYNGFCTIKGTLLQKPHSRVNCTINLSKYNQEELKEWLKETDYITATYSGYSVNKDKVITLLARDPQPTDMYISINGLAFTDQEMALAGNCCNNCGTIIEEEDSGAFWAKVTTNGDIKKLLCPTCTQNHSHLKHQYKNHAY
jgi:hypothetical protein